MTLCTPVQGQAKQAQVSRALPACLLLIGCLAYSWTTKVEAVFSRKVSDFLRDYTASHSWRQYSLFQIFLGDLQLRSPSKMATKTKKFSQLTSIYLWLYSPLLDLCRFFSFLIFYTVGRTPWTGVQPVARSLPAHRTAQTQNKCTHTSKPRVWFEPTIPLFERAKTARPQWSANLEVTDTNFERWNTVSL
jgi:hypothetical protein